MSLPFSSSTEPAGDHDLAMDDDVAAIGDPDRLIEVLLRHQHGQADAA